MRPVDLIGGWPITADQISQILLRLQDGTITREGARIVQDEIIRLNKDRLRELILLLGEDRI